MAFKDLDEFFDDGLELPIGGKVYRVPGVDIDTGLWCQELLERGKAAANGDESAATDELDDDEERDLYKTVLGPVYDALIADNVGWERLKHCGMTAFFWAAGNKTTAQKYWEAGGDPEALARDNRAQRRAKKSPASGSKKKAATGAGSGSRRASTSSTKTPR